MRVLILDNLRSGVGDADLYDFIRELGRRGCEVTLRFMAEGTELESLLGDAREFDRVVSAGGDGTVGAVTYLLRDTGVPVVAYPAGTANLLALNLRMPTDPIRLAQVTMDGAIVQVDLGELYCVDSCSTCVPAKSASSGFVVMAGAGFDAAIMEGAAELKSALGVGAYFLSAMGNLAPTVSKFTLTLDGEVVETEGIAVVLVNFAKIQFDLSVTHASDARDGMLEVVVLRSKTVAGLLPAVWAALLDKMGQHGDRSPSLEIHSARRIRIEADPPLPLQFDGETAQARTPFEALVLPGAATFIIPDAAALQPKDTF